VPAVFSVDGRDMVMERIHGPTMSQALGEQRLRLDEAAEVMAELHRLLHAVPSRTSDPAERILHMDIHPGNVMMGPDGPVLIDWCNVRDGPPDLDVAMSALILSELVAAGTDPRAPFVRALVTSFLAAADGDPVSHLVDAVPIRGSDPLLAPEEVARLDAAAEVVRACAPPPSEG
jgi:aminoglycoside phosphotransferase (APT) family kinase protein